ncbi:MAG TPA: porin [Thermoanaerobaculia bacterium]|nr:porin [Thermoanaerobaculia bacterium]
MRNVSVSFYPLLLGAVLGTTSMAGAQAPATPPPEVPAPTFEERIEELERKLRILERRDEIAAEQAAEKAKTAVTVTADRNGFSLRSADGAFQLKLRGYVHADGRAFLDDGERPATDTFVLRRVRPIFEGTLFYRFDFRIMPDFGEGRTVLQDAYLDFKLSKALQIRAGKFKSPFGLERLQSATDLVFVERALPTNLVPNRDLGVQLSGGLAGEKVSWALAYLNGVADGGSGDGDAEDAKDLAARVFVQPFAGQTASPWAGLGLGLAASRGDREGSAATPGLPSYRTPGQAAFFSYRSDGTAAGTTLADGSLGRWSPQLHLYRGSFGLLAELVRSRQEVERGASRAELEHGSHQVTVSWVLFGGSPSYRGVNPSKPLVAGMGGWGALEIAARWHRLTIDDDAFPVFANPASAAREATSWGFGVNWYLAKGVRLLLDYDQTSFEGGAAGGDRPEEKALFSRFQIAF